MSMSNSLRAALACLGMGFCMGANAADAADKFPGVGRAATTAEIAAWDIDVRPDFKGLPPGSGTVLRGTSIWEGKCASCHGSFGESNEIFTPIAGGTTADDIRSGRVAALAGNSQPQRTTLMKVSTVSTLWDYIHRAMPWDNPKTLSPDDVYAVTAYILNLGEIVSDDFELSDKNIADVQARMPNRNGMTREHGMWLPGDKPDTQNTACMHDCVEKVNVTSTLPDYARNAHGDIAAQNRLMGAVRGAATLAPALTGPAGSHAEEIRAHARQTLLAANTATPAKNGAPASPSTPIASNAPLPETMPDLAGFRLATSGTCVACHSTERKLIGPSYRDVAAKYKGQATAQAVLEQKIRNGGSGVWGALSMPPNPGVSDPDLKRIVDWILAGAPAPG